MFSKNPECLSFHDYNHQNLLVLLLTSKPQALRLREELLNTDVKELFLPFTREPEVELEAEDLEPPKQPNKFLKTLLNPPLSLATLPLEAQEILLGTPLLLNPPSISV